MNDIYMLINSVWKEIIKPNYEVKDEEKYWMKLKVDSEIVLKRYKDNPALLKFGKAVCIAFITYQEERLNG